MTANETQTAPITVLYFARLREMLGKSEEALVLPEGVETIGGLADFLRSRGGAWAVELGTGKAVRVAVNQDMADSETPIRGGEEVAFFPPVTGG